MPSLATLICSALLCAICGGLYLWWRSSEGPLHKEDRSTPAAYTSENVQRGRIYRVEQGGEVQDFEVILPVHWSGYFYIEVIPADGQELDRDRLRHEGWTRELPSNRVIEARHLLRELPEELRYAPIYN